jgi:hypothetical protein
VITTACPPAPPLVPYSFSPPSWWTPAHITGAVLGLVALLCMAWLVNMCVIRRGPGWMR